MFRRLAEAFQSSNNPVENPHFQYAKDQDVYFTSLTNNILSPNPGLKGFGTAIQSVDTYNKNYQPTFNEKPDDIFIRDTSPRLNDLAEQCSTSSIDELIRRRDPESQIGCGWLYTPPGPNSPYPKFSQGFIGNPDGPLTQFNPPDHRKWFFDLELAKKTILMDKCKALKECSDVGNEVFSGSCGYCKDTNQGIPIDDSGTAMYAGDPLGACDPNSIIRSPNSCPIPEPTDGPQPAVDRTCFPENGRLSSACLYNQVVNTGCSSKGSLALALSGNPPQDDYIKGIRDGDAVKIYNRSANPPLSMEVFSQGRATMDNVLKEVRQLVSNTAKPRTTALGAAARDLCLQTGSIADFDFCSELTDSSVGPFDPVCLQKIFRQMGGQPSGSKYPSMTNIETYNAMGTLGAVKQNFQSILQRMSSSDYDTQRQAMIEFLGIVPQRMLKRAPYSQGVEVFWFVQVPGRVNRVSGFLKRTIETNFINYGWPFTNVVPQVGFSQFTNFVALTDVRAQTDFSLRFSVLIDDGFFITVNQPVNSDAAILNDRLRDEPGIFANIGLQGPTTYVSRNCSVFKRGQPNITKMFFEDAGGGHHAFIVNPLVCSGTSNFSSPQALSLTCERRAPFLNFEVDNGKFQETRNPDFFSQFVSVDVTSFHLRAEDRNRTPAKKGFVRMNSANSCINMPNIAYQSWGSVTFCIRLQSMPIKETIINFATENYYFNLIAQPSSGSLTGISIEHNFDGPTKNTGLISNLELGTWYICTVTNRGTSFGYNLFPVNSMIDSKGSLISNTFILNANGKLWQNNATWNPAPGQPRAVCNVMVGTKNYTNWRGMYATRSFNYDLAWIHFYEQIVTADDIYRDCMGNWIFTQFPTSKGKWF